MDPMQSIEKIIAGVIEREGGYVDHPADRGGPTKFGITRKTLSAYLGRPATHRDVRELEEDTAREIYRRNYVKRPNFDELPPSIRPFVIDTGVHSGPRKASRMLQLTLNLAGFGPLKVDGIVGPKTLRVARRADEQMGDLLLGALILERLAFLDRLIERRPSQKVFERGWKSRVMAFWPETLELSPELEAVPWA